jgi:alkyldihydroxyacetonephosphate synthase
MLPPPTSVGLRDDLAALVDGGRASTDPKDRVAYARDLWPRQQIAIQGGHAAPSPPGVVVWPATTEEVARVVAFAADRGIPLVPYGAGSGVCGGVRPTPETIVLDVKRLRHVERIDEERLEVTAQAGIIGQHLEDRLGEAGYTLGHFPSSIYCSTLGGWLAGRSAGQCSGRYGKIEDMVVSLTCVDGAGTIWEGALSGDESGLLPLVVGSEGILAIITRAKLRIAPAPAARAFASFVFDGVASGLDAIRHIYQQGLRPAVCRLYDPFDTMLARQGGLRRAKKSQGRGPVDGWRPGRALRVLTRALRHSNALNALIHGLPDRALGGALMVMVWEDEPRIAAAEVEIARSIARDGRGRDTGEGPARRWLSHRHAVSYRQSPIFAAGGFVDTMEVASTWSRLLPMFHAVRDALSPHVFVMAHFSHAYPDGASIYFTFAGSARDDVAAAAVYERAWRDALEAVVSVGGTLSHHHGVGRSKAPMMRREQGAAVEVVATLKQVLDPSGILNPGAILGDVR